MERPVSLLPVGPQVQLILDGFVRAIGVGNRIALRWDRTGAATMDLIGLPWQLIVGPKGLERGVVELKRRSGGEREELSIESALARLTG